MNKSKPPHLTTALPWALSCSVTDTGVSLPSRAGIKQGRAADALAVGAAAAATGSRARAAASPRPAGSSGAHRPDLTARGRSRPREAQFPEEHWSGCVGARPGSLTVPAAEPRGRAVSRAPAARNAPKRCFKGKQKPKQPKNLTSLKAGGKQTQRLGAIGPSTVHARPCPARCRAHRAAGAGTSPHGSPQAAPGSQRGPAGRPG